jgi:hypothetical protein
MAALRLITWITVRQRWSTTLDVLKRNIIKESSKLLIVVMMMIMMMVMMTMMMMTITMMITMMITIVTSATVPCFVQGWVVLSDGLLIFGNPRDVTVF